MVSCSLVVASVQMQVLNSFAETQRHKQFAREAISDSSQFFFSEHVIRFAACVNIYLFF